MHVLADVIKMTCGLLLRRSSGGDASPETLTQLTQDGVYLVKKDLTLPKNDKGQIVQVILYRKGKVTVVSREEGYESLLPEIVRAFIANDRVVRRKKKRRMSDDENHQALLPLPQQRGEVIGPPPVVPPTTTTAAESAASLFGLNRKQAIEASRELESVKLIPELQSSMCLKVLDDAPGQIRCADWIYFITVRRHFVSVTVIPFFLAHDITRQIFGKISFRRLTNPARSVWFRLCDLVKSLLSPWLKRTEIPALREKLSASIEEIESTFVPTVMTLMFHKLGHLVDQVRCRDYLLLDRGGGGGRTNSHG